MRKTGRISTSELEEPKEEAVAAIHKFVKKWNATHTDAQFVFDFGWEIFLNKDTFCYFYELIDSLKRIDPENELGLIYTSENHYEEKDYQKGDFIAFSGAQIETSIPFVLNEEKMSPSGSRCSKCGAWHPFLYKTPPENIVIDESLLREPYEEATKPDDKEWDIIHVYTHIIISTKFKKILAKNNVKEYSLRSVFSHQTGRESQKMFELIASKSIIISALPEGETVQPFCDTCGTAHTPYEYDFAIKKEWIGDDDFFARAVYKGDGLHMSNRVFKLVRKHQLYGFIPQSVVAVV